MADSSMQNVVRPHFISDIGVLPHCPCDLLIRERKGKDIVNFLLDQLCIRVYVVPSDMPAVTWPPESINAIARTVRLNKDLACSH